MTYWNAPSDRDWDDPLGQDRGGNPADVARDIALERAGREARQHELKPLCVGCEAEAEGDADDLCDACRAYYEADMEALYRGAE